MDEERNTFHHDLQIALNPLDPAAQKIKSGFELCFDLAGATLLEIGDHRAIHEVRHARARFGRQRLQLFADLRLEIKAMADFQRFRHGVVPSSNMRTQVAQNRIWNNQRLLRVSHIFPGLRPPTAKHQTVRGGQEIDGPLR